MNRPEQLTTKVQRISRLRTLLTENEIFLADLRTYRGRFDKSPAPRHNFSSQPGNPKVYTERYAGAI